MFSERDFPLMECSRTVVASSVPLDDDMVPSNGPGGAL